MVKPPHHLSQASKSLWAKILDEFRLADHELSLLQLACESLDQAERARGAIERDGETTLDRFGQILPSPWIKIQRDAQRTAALLLKQLKLPEPVVPAVTKTRSPRRGMQ